MSKTLIGNDGFLILAEIGAELIGDSTSDLDTLVGGGVGSGAGLYHVTEKIGATIPVSKSSYFYDDGTMIPDTGDKIIKIPIEKTDANTTITEWSVELKRDEVSTLTLTDDVKTARAGRREQTGSLSGLYRVGEMGTISDRFFTTVTNTGGVNVEQTVVDKPLYFVGYLDYYDTEKILVVGKVELSGFGVKNADASAQDFTSGFKPVSGEQIIKVIIK